MSEMEGKEEVGELDNKLAALLDEYGCVAAAVVYLRTKDGKRLDTNNPDPPAVKMGSTIVERFGIPSKAKGVLCQALATTFDKWLKEQKIT